jgi:phage terminase Nu1 subunit (DNA packaging protein)
MKSKVKPAATIKPKMAATKTTAKKTVPAEKKAPPEKNNQEKRDTITTDELRELMGGKDKISAGRISQLIKEGVIEPLPSGSRKEGYSWKAFITVVKLMRYYRELSDSRRSGDSEEMKNAKERQAKAKAKLEELKLAQLEGNLHKAEDIERIMGAMLTRLRINLLAIPMGLAPILRDMDDTREIAEKLDKRIRRAMNEVAHMDLKKLVEEESLSVEET